MIQSVKHQVRTPRALAALCAQQKASLRQVLRCSVSLYVRARKTDWAAFFLDLEPSLRQPMRLLGSGSMRPRIKVCTSGETRTPRQPSLPCRAYLAQYSTTRHSEQERNGTERNGTERNGTAQSDGGGSLAVALPLMQTR